MPAMKHSRQREAIKEYLRNSHDHPSADMVYMNIRQEFPNISLGTVYRNLSLLSELGEINKISTGSGPDRFDGDLHPHYHFVCSTCGNVKDFNIPDHNIMPDISTEDFDGMIDGHVTYFYGTCGDCLKKEKVDKKIN